MVENLQKSDTNSNKSASPVSDKQNQSNSEEKSKEEYDKDPPEKDKDVNFLVIKEEPLDWSEYHDEMNESEMFHTEMTIKPEIIFPTEDGDMPEESEEMYSPLTCELCSEVFHLPADWVKHIRTHTDMQPAKRQRRGRPSVVSCHLIDFYLLSVKLFVFSFIFFCCLFSDKITPFC